MLCSKIDKENMSHQHPMLIISKLHKCYTMIIKIVESYAILKRAKGLDWTRFVLHLDIYSWFFKIYEQISRQRTIPHSCPHLASPMSCNVWFYRIIYHRAQYPCPLNGECTCCIFVIWKNMLSPLQSWHTILVEVVLLLLKYTT